MEIQNFWRIRKKINPTNKRLFVLNRFGTQSKFTIRT